MNYDPAEITTTEPAQSQSINSASIGEGATAILQRHSTPGMIMGWTSTTPG